MSKKVMILGAGVYQVPLIEKSKSRGYQTIVVSPFGDYPGIPIADCFINLDITKSEEIYEYAKSLEIDAILTTGSDVGVPTIGYVCEKLNLPGISHDAALTCSNKILMKERLLSSGVRTARFESITSKDELVSSLKNFDFPVVVKAPNLSGSRGISIVHTVEDAIVAYDESVTISKNKRVLVEEYLDGEELGAEAIVINGQEPIVVVHDRVNYSAKTAIPVGHSLPSTCSIEVRDRIESLMKGAIDSIGISNTVCNADIMVVDSQPYIIEIGGRMGATCIPENIGTYFDVNMYDVILDISLGRKAFINPTPSGSPNISMLLFSEVSGVIKEIKAPNSDGNNVVELKVDREPGDFVNKFQVGPDRLGHVVVRGDSLDNAKSNLNELLLDFKLLTE